MKGFEQVDISGDVGLRIWGRSIGELFENAGLGMSDLITDTTNIDEEEAKEIHIDADGLEALLVQWLNELIFIFDSSGFIGKRFMVRIKDNSLRAEVYGRSLDPSRNERRLLLKAATYHGLSLKREKGRYEAMLIFDI